MIEHSFKFIMGWIKTPYGIVAVVVSVLLALIGAWMLDYFDKSKYCESRCKKWEV